MEQEEQWVEEEAAAAEAALRGRRRRNRDDITTTSGTVTNGSEPLNPANGTGSINEEEEEEIVGNEEGWLEKTLNPANENESLNEKGEEVETEENINDVVAVNEVGRLEKTLNHENETGSLNEEDEVGDEEGNEVGRLEKALNPANGTGSLTEEVLVEEETDENINDAEGIEEGRLEKSIYFDREKDTESTNGVSGMQYSSNGCSVLGPNPGYQKLNVTEKNFDIQESPSTVISHQYEEALQDETLSGFSFLPSERSFEEQNTSYEILNKGLIEKADAFLIKESDQEIRELDIERIEKADAILIKESDQEIRELDIESIEKADTILMKQSDHEVIELDIERVLEKQETHDLYCPNCNSCITRRVVLRKRKRKIGNIQLKAKRDKIETKVDSELEADPAHSANGKTHDTVDTCLDGGPTPAVSDYNKKREPDIFRCLSCFSFFIPAGNGVKLFRFFGDRKENEDMQNLQQISVTNTNWFFSIFSPDRGKLAIEQGRDAWDNSEVDIVKQLDSYTFSNDVQPQLESDHSATPLTGGTLVNAEELEKDAILEPRLVTSTARSLMLEESQIDQKYNVAIRNETLPDQNASSYEVSSTQGPMFLGKVTSDLGERSFDAVEKNNTGSTAQEHILEHILPDHVSDYAAKKVAERALVETEKPAEHTTVKSQLGALKMLVPVIAVSSMLDKAKKSEIDLGQGSDVELGNEALPDQKGHASSIQGAPLSVQSFFPGGIVNELISQSVEARKDIVVPQGTVHVEKSMTNVREKSYDAVEKNNTGDDVILTVETGAVQAAASQREENIIILGETEIQTRTEINEGEQSSAEANEVQSWDILKSIVYGGLIESITSLSVVSSAAGADAATLNVLALGLANLIGGLFIIGHNLSELKNDHSGEASSQTNKQVDRCEELLGQRKNFILHATVAVLSFLIFGLLPPVIYGFSFRKSDNRDLKLVAVMAASLLCIILLAIGKCYVQRRPKSYIKTVLYYVIMGIMASGASYIVGSLIQKLLEKLGWFESSSSSFVAMTFPNTGAVKPGMGILLMSPVDPKVELG